MWAAITAIVTTVIAPIIPLILQLIVYIIKKKKDNDKNKEEFIKIIQEIQANENIPEKLRKKYEGQLERIKGKLLNE